MKSCKKINLMILQNEEVAFLHSAGDHGELIYSILVIAWVLGAVS